MAEKQIRNKIQSGEKLNLLDDYGGVPSVDDDGNLQTLISKVDKVGKFWEGGKADGDLVRYLPNILPVTRQNQIAGINPRQAYASETYTDKKNLEYTIILAANTYTNYSTMEIILLIWFVKNTAKTAALAGTLFLVNNFFERWFTEIDIKRYPDDMKILPTNKTMEIYDYANAQLKYLPPNSVKKLLKPLLYLNTDVYLDEDADRRDNDTTQVVDRSDPNITFRIAQPAAHIHKKNE